MGNIVFQRKVVATIMKNEMVKGICILLDDQRDKAGLLDAAATLAAHMKVELQGLFIEEDDLIRAADLSISRDISRWSAQENVINRKNILCVLRIKARQKQQELETIAHQKHIKCSFQTVRAERVSWILNSANTSDVIFIPKRTVAESRQNFNYTKHVKDPLYVLYNGSRASQKALEISSKITQVSKTQLIVLLLTDKATDEVKLIEQVDKALVNSPTATSTFVIKDKDEISEIQRQSSVSMLIVPSDIEWLHIDGFIENLLKWSRYPIVLVR